MVTTYTPQLGMTHLEPGQASAETSVNDIANKLDAVVQLRVKDELAAVPGSPANGDTYIATADWSGAGLGILNKQVAFYYNGWIGLSPKEGWFAWVADLDLLKYFDNDVLASGSWLTYTAPAGAATSSFAFSADISPAQITIDQNNYSPTGLSTATTLRLSSDASRNITGIDRSVFASSADGQILIIHNVGSFNIVLKDSDGGSSAANQFALTADVTLTPDSVVLLQYDSTTTRWRAIAGGGGAGVTDGDKGDITVSGGGATWTIDPAAVSFAKIQNVSTARLAGRTSGGSGSLEELTVIGGLSLGGGALTIADDGVTYAKIQNVSATDKLLGRSTAGAGDIEEIACTAAARTVLDDASVSAMVDTLGGAAATGSGGLVRATSPTLVTPVLGVAAATSLTLTTDLAVADGGTGASTAATARANLGAAPNDPSYLTLATNSELTSERVATAGDGVKLTDAGAGGALTIARRPAREVVYIVDDFLGGLLANQTGFCTANRGTGTSSNTAINGTADHPGICQLLIAAGASDSAALSGKSASGMLFGGGKVIRESVIRIPTLSDGTDRFVVRVGFTEEALSTDVDAAYFRYTDNVNTGKFEIVTRSNSVETANDSGTTVAANTWYNLRIEINAAGTSAEFFINGSSVGTNTTNIPVGAGRETTPCIIITRSAGTANRTLETDLEVLEIQLTTAR